MPILNVARAADRIAMAARVTALVSLPWSAEVETMGRETWVNLSGPCGLRLTVDLDGESKQQREGVFVLAWHIRGFESAARMNPNVMIGCNPHHFGKLTEVAYSFESLLAIVAKRMASAVDGSAFQ